MNPEDIPLRDLHLPAPLGGWPPAPGWWLLMAIAAAALVWLALRMLRQWRRGRARRVALLQLKSLTASHAQHGDVRLLAKGVSALLRRAMLAYAARDEVASLTGDDWLQWLDRGLTEPVFSNGPGRSLSWLPYRDLAPGDDAVDVDALLRAARLRLTTPLPEELR